MASILSNYEFQLTGKLSVSGTTVSISTDLERNQTVTFTDAFIVMRNKKGNKIERMKGTASGGTLTLSKRGLDQSDVETEVAGLKLEWQRGTVVYVSLLAPQIVDKASSNTFATATTQFMDNASFSGNVVFSGTSMPGLNVKELTTAQVNALPLTTSWIVKDTTTGDLKYSSGGAVYPISGGSTQPNASTTVAGKVEAPTQTEVEQLATTGGTGALVFVTPTTINPNSITVATPAAEDKISFSDASDSNYLKSTTINTFLSNFLLGTLFGNGTDGDVTISGTGTTTLTRDMYYNNLTINSGATLDPAGYRIFVKGTISGTGTINRNGNNGANGTALGVGGAAGATLNQGSLNAEIASGKGGGDGTTTQAQRPGVAGSAANPSMVNVNGVAGGLGGWAAGGSPTTYAGGAAGASTRGANYNKGFPYYIVHPATGGSLTMEAYKSIAGSGGGGSGGRYSSNPGGGGGGGGGNGGFIWMCVNRRNFTGTITATGGNGGNGSSGALYGGGGGGGGGGNGGTVLRIYGTMVNDCTKTLTGGTGGAKGIAIGVGGTIGRDGNDGTNGNAGTVIDIQL